ncbi:helix-turn-helix domain-containing protein [Spirosoma sp. HMF4905]|uniref:Helix-turn-helix domain-containing protein n=1 Tax=Spirosoma arboris TaxID=2682092 RepID=A0A7K1SJH3_9BACT|nr:helix-turn-helix transcriptional regulator [Spirosoma arboris]MVM33942.1 helix-turn-helix domain-containing protein [Spirosoma arboris]
MHTDFGDNHPLRSVAKDPILVYQMDEHSEGIALFKLPLPMLQQYQDELAHPHRHDHYTCFFLEEGTITTCIDFQPVTINKTSFLLSYPGQIHQVGSAPPCKGWILGFDAKLIDETVRNLLEQSLSSVTLLTLDEREQEWFRNMLILIDESLHKNKTVIFHHKLVQTLLNGFIYRVAAIFQVQLNDRIRDYSSRNLEMTRKFRQLLNQQVLICKQPSSYAQQLNVSTSHLNDTVKSVTGFSVTYHIQQSILTEAQRLLVYTDLSVQEISTRLGFEDPKYFIRLFGKGKGLSPAKFRKNNT